MLPIVIIAATIGTFIAYRRGWFPGMNNEAVAPAAAEGGAATLTDLTARLRQAEAARDTAEAALANARETANRAALNYQSKASAGDPQTGVALAEAQRARAAAEAAAAEAAAQITALQRAAQARNAVAGRLADQIAQLATSADAIRRELNEAEVLARFLEPTLRQLGNVIAQTLAGVVQYPEVWRYSLADGGLARVPYTGPIQAVSDDSITGQRVIADRDQAARGYSSPTYPNVRLVTAAERGYLERANSVWAQIEDTARRLDAARAAVPPIRERLDRANAAVAAARAALTSSENNTSTPLDVRVPMGGQTPIVVGFATRT